MKGRNPKWWRGLLLVGMMGVGVLAFSRLGSVKAGTEADETAAARKAYNERIAAKYNFRYGRVYPFLPSNANTPE